MSKDLNELRERARLISGAEHIGQSRQQVQRPWGRSMICMMEEEQRPVLLVWNEGGENGRNWGGEITMKQFLQRLRIVVRTLDFTLSELGASRPFE